MHAIRALLCFLRFDMGQYSNHPRDRGNTTPIPRVVAVLASGQLWQFRSGCEATSNTA